MIAVNVGIWALQLILYYASPEWLGVSMDYGYLTSEKVFDGYVYQLATYMFFHDLQSPMHLLFNMLLVYFFAPSLEDRWGIPKTLGFAFASGVAGGAMVVVFHLLGAPSITLGFSGAALGMLAAFCLLNAEAQILLFFIIPIKAKYILPMTVAIDFLLWITPGTSDVSFAAHLGGILFAIIALSGWWRPSRVIDEIKYRKAKRGLEKYYKERGDDNVVKGPWLH